MWSDGRSSPALSFNSVKPGDRLADLELRLGPPLSHQKTLYTYPDGLQIDCGSASQGQRWVSHIQLQQPARRESPPPE